MRVSRGHAQASTFAEASARRGVALVARRSAETAGIARRRSSTPSTSTSTSSRLLPSPPRSSFSRIPFESLDYDRASDAERRRRRRKARRRRHDDDEDDEDDDDDEEDYSDDAFNDDEDASGLEPGFPSAALPGSQVARLKDLAAQSAARRDFHWVSYRAQSAKSNLLSVIVLGCTTAGGTSGLISLTQAANNAVPPTGGFSGLVPDASMFHGMTSAAAQAAREAAAASAAAAAAAAANANASSNHAAALLSPVLGYAATLVSGLQNYSKPSTAASR